MKEIPIYFSDLNERAQKQLLDACGLEKPEDANWSTNPNMDVFPLFLYHVENEEEDPDNAEH